jgi:hypothetical protein
LGKALVWTMPVEVAGGVGAEEQVGGIVVELGALGLVQGVLDGQLVQPELGVDHVEVAWRGSAQVQPNHRRRIAHVLGDVGDREVLQQEGAVAVQPGTGLRVGPDPRGCRR